MKKTLAMVLAMVMAASLTACSGGGSTASTTAAAAQTTAAAETEAAAAETEAVAEGEDAYADLGDFTMIVGHAQPEGNPRYVSMEQFAADVAEKTNGHVTVEVFGNG